MEYIPGKITVVQTMPKRYMRAIFKKLLVKEEVIKGAVKNMIVVEKSLLWCTLLHGRSC